MNPLMWVIVAFPAYLLVNGRLVEYLQLMGGKK